MPDVYVYFLKRINVLTIFTKFAGKKSWILLPSLRFKQMQRFKVGSVLFTAKVVVAYKNDPQLKHFHNNRFISTNCLLDFDFISLYQKVGLLQQA